MGKRDAAIAQAKAAEKPAAAGSARVLKDRQTFVIESPTASELTSGGAVAEADAIAHQKAMEARQVRAEQAIERAKEALAHGDLAQ
jgi:hypothetical protein